MKDDTALLRQALEALENPDRMIEIEPNHWEYIRDLSIVALRTRLNLCPDCGSNTRLSRGWVSNIETFWRSCEECEWRGEPE
jgi:hypothetical protein